MKSSYHFLLALSSLFVSYAQEPIQRDSITELDEVILLDSLQSAPDNGIIATKIIGTKVFQNYSPVDMVSQSIRYPEFIYCPGL